MHEIQTQKNVQELKKSQSSSVYLPEQTVYLIDGSGYIFRAYYAVTKLSTKEGFPTNALFGFSRMLLKFLKQYMPKYIGVVFDAAKLNFRHELYAEYKANRKEMPEDLAAQIPYFSEICKALGLEVITLPGYEADDVIGTFSAKFSQLNAHTIKVVIISSDKDLLQLVDDNTDVVDPMKELYYQSPQVKERFGVSPEQVIDILALVGDSSDNIPGIEGVGPKTAATVINEIGGVHYIIENIEKIKNQTLSKKLLSVINKIELNPDKLRLSYNLAKVAKDAPIVINRKNLSAAQKITSLQNHREAKEILRPNDALTDASPTMDLDNTITIEDADKETLLSFLERQQNDQRQLQQFAKKFEFSSLFKDLVDIQLIEESAPHSFHESSSNDNNEVINKVVYKCINSSEFEAWFKEFEEQLFDRPHETKDDLLTQIKSSVFIDTIEIPFPEFPNNRCILIFLSQGNETLACIPCMLHDSSVAIPFERELQEHFLPFKYFLEKLKPFFEDKDVCKIGFLLKRSAKLLLDYDVKLRGVIFDAMIASQMLDSEAGVSIEEAFRRHLPNELVDEVYPEERIFLEEVVVKKTSKKSAFLKGEQLSLFGEEQERDVKISFDDLLKSIEDRISSQSTLFIKSFSKFRNLTLRLLQELTNHNLLHVFSSIEMPLIPILASLEHEGVRIDKEYFSSMGLDIEEKLQSISKSIYEYAGTDFNINSPKQLADILFSKLLLPTKGLKKTKTGISTDVSVLEKLSEIHPMPKLVLDQRVLQKLKTTYVDVLPRLVSPITNRLHTTFNQLGAATGRLSSQDPNLQNIPIQNEYGRRIRNAFIAKAGAKLISADYSQIELRVLAHMSSDQALIEAFQENKDIHDITAREIFSIPEGERVTPLQRRVGKVVNFGVIYGMGSYSLSTDLKIPLREAERYIEKFFHKYSGVKTFFAAVEKDLFENGEVRTFFGRRRYFKEIDAFKQESGKAKKLSQIERGFLYRAAINAPIQGTAADIIKLAMIALQKEIEEKRLPMVMILQIHDELLFECDESFSEKASKIIKSAMLQVISWQVPLDVTVSIGDNWGEIH
jgi:DNA polymerase I